MVKFWRYSISCLAIIAAVSSAYSLDKNSEIKPISQNQTESEIYYRLSLKAYENKDYIKAIELARLSYKYGSIESAVILGEIFRK